MIIKKILAIIIIFSINISTAIASSNKVSIIKNNVNTNFKYEWFNQDNKPSGIIFSIENKKTLKTNIFDSIDGESKRDFNNKILLVEKEIKENASYGFLEIKLEKDLSMHFKYPKDYEGTKELADAQSKAKDILRKSQLKLGRFININESLLLNYEMLVRNSMGLTDSISKSFIKKHGNANPRVVINDIISFYQSIPYDEIKEYKYGFINTNEMLLKNKGDCDSKSVSFISTVKNIYKGLKTIIVVIDGHAFVGLNISSLPTDKTITHRNVRYVLAEPVGPSKSKLGQISVKSSKEINKKSFKIFII